MHDSDTEGCEFALDAVFFCACKGAKNSFIFGTRLFEYVDLFYNILYLHFYCLLNYEVGCEVSLSDLKSPYIFLLILGWDESYGGFTSYIAKGEDEEVIF